ncbi:MAG: hypothetical protein WAK29_10410 [Terriglobales bacterium]
MWCSGRGIALGLLLAAPGWSVGNLAAQDQTSPTVAAVTPHRHKSHKTQKELVLPPMPNGPLSQLPMDQIPASPAKVSYEEGLLTISAQNSTLGEILRDVRKLTGASIEIPQGTGAGERVVAHLGPGAPRDVLAGLLNGSSFNYVMLGSSSDPTAVSSVILTAKSATGETQNQTAANVAENGPSPGNAQMPPTRFSPPGPFPPGGLIGQRPGGNPGIAQAGNMPPGAVQTGTEENDDAKDDDQDSADDSPDDQEQQPAQAGVSAQEQQDSNQPNAGPKTPEQILEMLRRQQQPGALPTAPGSTGTPQTPPN